MKTICVIPAKGRSTRLPGKNIRLFHGKPIIEYTIEAAIESGCFDSVIVSSDTAEIWDIAEKRRRHGLQ
jgi:pseudaminic acid cytidylyltransferase